MESKPVSAAMRRSLVIFKSAVSVLWRGRKPDWNCSYRLSNKVIKDKFGRYLIIQGTLLTEQIILANMYAPNTNSPNLFQNVILALSTLLGKCVVVGDFNCALDLVKDRTSGAAESHIRSRAITQHFMK